MANEQNLKPWKKGQSGNPKGRPLKPVSAILREFGEYSEIKYDVTLTDVKGRSKRKYFKINSNEEGATINEAIALELLSKALRGDMPAIKEVLDRQEGRAKQEVDLKGTMSNEIDTSKLSDEELLDIADKLLALESKD